MSMLQHFFSINGDQALFDGLAISKDREVCEKYRGKYPVIFLSLKGINAATYEKAFDLAVQIMKEVAGTAQFLLESNYLSDYDKSEYQELLDSSMSEAVFCGGLKKLSMLLEKHYKQKVILLLDEYDVPLAKAFENGYYDQRKENFYHGILLDILGVKEEWCVFSNWETGDGYSDILIETENSEIAILIEVKYAINGNLDQACERALEQIEEKRYDGELQENGIHKILKYGIACYKKRCRVKMIEEKV